jgi:acyl-CoA dehydrogenase
MSAMPDLEAFRDEIRAWLEAHAPPSLRGTRKGRFDGYWGGRQDSNPPADVRRWLEIMLERGLTAPTWPRRYGGAELAVEQAKVLDEELRRLMLPPPVVGFGLTMLGPTLLEFGTDAQKAEHLPAICRGAIRWCQGYSEPGAGSDLASLSTRAARDGNAFVVNGQKIWTSNADLSDWIFCLVRTDASRKKQQGITFLLIDMATPGVTTKRIKLISGASPFCEVFFENVRVPLANAVGEIDAGWTVAKALLGHERSMISEAIGGQLAGAEQSLVELARRELGCPTGPLPDAEIRAGVTRLAMQEAAYQLTLERIRRTVEAGAAPGPESSILKICGSELKQRRYELAMQIAGPQGLGWEGPGFEPAELELTREWLRSRANSIEGGSSEIQLNIIAKRVLGLPD